MSFAGSPEEAELEKIFDAIEDQNESISPALSLWICWRWLPRKELRVSSY
jgi:hypothetical protein